MILLLRQLQTNTNHPNHYYHYRRHYRHLDYEHNTLFNSSLNLISLSLSLSLKSKSLSIFARPRARQGGRNKHQLELISGHHTDPDPACTAGTWTSEHGANVVILHNVAHKSSSDSILVLGARRLRHLSQTYKSDCSLRQNHH